MPIYEYRCAKCGDFDVTQKITEKPLKKCPTCKGKVAKLISSPAFHLKGSGWYVTDYAGKKGGGGDSKDSDGAPSSGSATESTKTEPPKPAEKASASTTS